jgi:hypothetical protein
MMKTTNAKENFGRWFVSRENWKASMLLNFFFVLVFLW